jgi:hypothetical protein
MFALCHLVAARGLIPRKRMAGQLINKPREKMITWDGLLKAANEE